VRANIALSKQKGILRPPRTCFWTGQRGSTMRLLRLLTITSAAAEIKRHGAFGGPSCGSRQAVPRCRKSADHCGFIALEAKTKCLHCWLHYGRSTAGGLMCISHPGLEYPSSAAAWSMSTIPAINNGGRSGRAPRRDFMARSRAARRGFDQRLRGWSNWKVAKLPRLYRLVGDVQTDSGGTS
jgi:hypothetical protein